jgi:hypothetical protein
MQSSRTAEEDEEGIASAAAAAAERDEWKEDIVRILQSRVKELEMNKQEDDISLKDCIKKLALISKRIVAYFSEVMICDGYDDNSILYRLVHSLLYTHKAAYPLRIRPQ